MPRLLRRALQVIAVLLVLATAAAVWKREEITRLMAVNSLFDAETIVQNFSHMDQLFLTRPLSRGAGPVSPLPPGPPAELSAEAAQWVKDRAITGLVLLKNGQLVHESYYLGTGAEDLRISWSMAKSFLVSLFGILNAEGAFASLDDPVVRYAPGLTGSAYDGATIRDVLTMSSGVAFNEDYLDFNSDINKMGRVLALGGSMDAFAAGLVARDADPGARFHYVSIDTHVLGMVMRGATGKDIPELLESRLLAPLGLEAAPYYLTDGEGVALVLGGLNLRTRDYARFGQMVLQGGKWQGAQVVPEPWVIAMTSRQASDGSDYGFQWWIPENASPGEVMAQGIYGQYIYINPGLGVVIAVNAADRNFEAPGVVAGNLAMLRAMAAGLAGP
ncbi:serine hydrolase domain-containing protein [Tabrizicola oligotrophica]|uniref:Serine hydrolase n=1 Tax=Tabrizicola oligotrophica TaxID=2710650 RepID=A0A6M0QXM1_9RHOB|nr:serine hydrolase [Tabrizicola oligotrophica]NEY91504.1 serine hydrolase [Tabrizicola oligotrophica]